MYARTSGERLEQKILLSVALPRDEELECALNGASYQLSKRSGFVASSDYADEWRKRKNYLCLYQVLALNSYLKGMYMMYRMEEVIRFIDMQNRCLWGCRYE